jgi:hypothetical protein
MRGRYANITEKFTLFGGLAEKSMKICAIMSVG